MTLKTILIQWFGFIDAASEQTIIDQTETNLVALRRTIYLTIQSSVGAEECAHKLLKMNLRPGQEVCLCSLSIADWTYCSFFFIQMELCRMILDSCAQQRTYERFFGLLGQRFCLLKKEYVECFEKVFEDQYEIVHRLENVKLRNVAKFFAHLLVTDAISWGVCIELSSCTSQHYGLYHLGTSLYSFNRRRHHIVIPGLYQELVFRISGISRVNKT